jgi:pimeloyl-ACP methyl ester carboxylesterase
VDSLTAAYLAYNKFVLHRTSLRSTFSIFPFRLANLFTNRTSPSPSLSYWHRPHTSKTRSPILFIHGISIGLYSYAQFLAQINKDDARSPEDGEVGIIAVEIMPISFRITGEMPSKDELVRQIDMILEAHGWDQVVLASHSYGSVISTHLLQNPKTSRKIGPVLLIDPVTFLLHLPDVCYNFTARKPRRANEFQLWYFACTDMMVAHTLARHFFWTDNIMFKDELRGRNATISLGGRDQIADTNTVGKYISGIDLRSEDMSWKDKDWVGVGLETIWWSTCDHAQVFERKDGRRKLGEVVRKYAEMRTAREQEEEERYVD